MSIPDPAPIHPPEEREAAPGSAPAGGRGRSLAEDLEDGPLRRELLGEPPAPPDLPPAPEPVFRARLVFDGTGSEYFRIWVVNSLLTLLTLGVYSAWAKVRKARWFAQHTSLLGDRFDYHGDPWRILLGRVLALGLLALWTWSFDISLWLGFGVLGLMLVAGPVLFAGAQRFKLANTSWRGLRFGFHAPRREVYLVCVPLLLVWTLGTALSAAEAPMSWVLGASGLLTLLLPWAHARLKRLQHAQASFGGQTFAFEPAATAFYGLYGKGLVLAIVGGMFVAMAALIVEAVQRDIAGPAAGGDKRMQLHLLLASGGVVLVIWLAVWPYFAARTQQIVWGHTRFAGSVGFAGQMRGWALWKLAMGQTVLTLLTAGLYWPFAAVAIARYRIEHLMVVGDAPLSGMRVLAAPVTDGRAAGDGAADMFGLDLGW
jgi:uncharacterized membrane protein YjgN (DUF898 family)